MTAPETPASLLRRAAATLREHAEAATEGPWQHMCLGSEGCLVLRAHGTVRERDRNRVARFGHKDWQDDHADAVYVAVVHPVFALAVAGWLDAVAEQPGAYLTGYPDGLDMPLTVARAILGETQAKGAS